MNSPATSRVGNGGCPGPTPHTELKRPARKAQSISPASRTSGWRKVMISSGGGREKEPWRDDGRMALGIPPRPTLPAYGDQHPPKRAHAAARKLACTYGFLSKLITCSGQIIAIDQSLPNSSRTTRVAS